MELKLKELRTGRFLTQRELARQAGISQVTIVRLEQGKQEPTFSTIRKLAAALGVEPSELVVRE